jgi:hypothetical protein
MRPQWHFDKATKFPEAIAWLQDFNQYIRDQFVASWQTPRMVKTPLFGPLSF